MWSTDQGVIYSCTLPPMTEQLTISHYNINTISSRQVMGIKKLIWIRALLVDPKQNSLNYHLKNCMADNKEILEVKASRLNRALKLNPET